jgi:hypothetical protein
LKPTNVAVGDDKQRVLDMVRNLAKDTVQAAKTQVPDASQQVQRIEAARESKAYQSIVIRVVI